MPKKPTTISFAAVGVTLDAVTDVEVFPPMFPLVTSIGFEVSTPV